MALLASRLPQFCEICCPCGLHCVISGLLAVGSLVSQCCVGFLSHRVRVWRLFVIVAGFFLVCFDRHSNSEDGSLFNVCLPDATRQRLAGFWILSMNLWECCPCGLHSVISRLLAGGSLGFRIVHLLFLAHRLLSGTLWFVVSLLFYIAIPIPEVIQCCHLFLHFPIVHELIS